MIEIALEQGRSWICFVAPYLSVLGYCLTSTALVLHGLCYVVFVEGFTSSFASSRSEECFKVSTCSWSLRATKLCCIHVTEIRKVLLSNSQLSRSQRLSTALCNLEMSSPPGPHVLSTMNNEKPRETDASLSLTNINDSHRPSFFTDVETATNTPRQPSPNPSITAQEWTSETDPENPLNWSLRKRIYVTSVPTLYCFTVTLASSTYTSGTDEIQAHFDVRPVTALLGLSLFVWGLAAGPIIAAPLSESYGRLFVYRTTLPIFGLFILGAGLARNFATVAICRFLAGVFGSPALAVGGGTNADIWLKKYLGRTYLIYLAAPFFGPTLGTYEALTLVTVWLYAFMPFALNEITAVKPCVLLVLGPGKEIFSRSNRMVLVLQEDCLLSLVETRSILTYSPGPVIGGIVAAHKSFRWLVYTILSAIVGVYIYSLPVPETYKKAILGARAKRLNLPPPPSLAPPGFLPALKFFCRVTILKPIKCSSQNPSFSPSQSM